ncbi:MAG: DUF2600 family protein, partial [Clostridia bacterium]|nr:DUF2600 family protein [Clostridia bacterium]
GAAYALLAPPEARAGVLRWIVALQTTSDFLDNLADRTGERSLADLRALHDAFLDGASLAREPRSRLAAPVGPSGYYRFHPAAEDVYLPRLVALCREELARIPGAPSVAEEALDLAQLYVELQVRKHAPSGRTRLLTEWFAAERERRPELAGVAWWEFAAAAGSTLGLFALLALAAGCPEGLAPPERARILRAYFPWIAALHILLDYAIDQDEDRAGGDLNLVAQYPDDDAAAAGLIRIYREARRRARELPGPAHAAIVDGLVGLYLSDPKARSPRLRAWTRRVLAGMDPPARALQQGARLARIAGGLA